MRARNPNWSARAGTLLSVLAALGLIVSAMPCAAQVGDEDELGALLAALTPADLAALIQQSEDDSLAIRELQIRLFYAEERVRIAEDERPNWLERFFARYGFALGAAAGVYVGAAAAR